MVSVNAPPTCTTTTTTMASAGAIVVDSVEVVPDRHQRVNLNAITHNGGRRGHGGRGGGTGRGCVHT